MTFSARLNDDGSYRGMAWNADHAQKEPLAISGIKGGEYYYTRKDAIRAVKAMVKAKKSTRTK